MDRAERFALLARLDVAVRVTGVRAVTRYKEYPVLWIDRHAVTSESCGPAGYAADEATAAVTPLSLLLIRPRLHRRHWEPNLISKRLAARLKPYIERLVDV